jgi:hypothetical protein
MRIDCYGRWETVRFLSPNIFLKSKINTHLFNEGVTAKNVRKVIKMHHLVICKELFQSFALVRGRKMKQ